MLDRPSHRPELIASQVAAPLVMLPGTLCDARVFGPVLKRLGIDAQVTELIGAETTGAMAQLILAQAPDRISLCGFSLGAIVALEIVARAPQRVERLALIGCNPGLLDTRARRTRAAQRREEFTTAGDPQLVRLMAEEASEDSWHQQTAITLSRADSLPRLRHIACPTLVLCGAQDPICPPALSRTIADAIPGGHLAIIEQAGHYVTLDQPEAVATEIAAWLATPTHSPH
ncbi:MAG: alpha/beta hydrolase [Devosia sp.]